MRHIFFVSLYLLLCNSFAWAGFNDLKAPIEANSCRLANSYMIKSQEYSGSAGTTIKGNYDTAKDKDACLKKCESDEKLRVEEKPEIYGLKVACYFGKEKLYEREHN